MIKRHISMLSIVVLLLATLCACASGDQTSVVDTYLSLAEDYVQQDNYDAAIDILQKGFAETKDERIAVRLAELSSSNIDTPSTTEATSSTEASSAAEATSVTEDSSPTSKSTSLKSYIGTWASEDIGWEYGGMIMDVECTDKTITVILSYTQGAPMSRIAEIIIEEELSNIRDGILVAELLEDSWGNKATIQIQFIEPDIIRCYIVDVVHEETAMWGFYEGTYELYKNDTAHENMNYTMDDYFQIHSEEKPTEPPVYDTSKASGILAQAGLTEQEFRNICTYIGSRYHENNTYVYAMGREYYNQHPEEAKRIDDYTLYWYDYEINGSASEYYTIEREEAFKTSSNLEEFLNHTIYGPKGASILGKQSENILKGMQEYPADYVNQPFLLKDFRTTYVNNYTYTDDCYILYNANISVIDYRDDVSYPNILQGMHYDMYVVFLGTNGSDNLVFALISVEKCP